MNDLEAALRATYQARGRRSELAALLDEVLAIPETEAPGRGRWPTRPAWRFQPMLNATKLVVAGSIVAVFGGFLLADVLTAPSVEHRPAVGDSASAAVEHDDATIRSDLLPGVDLVVDEVEPGVYRVISDGVRDLADRDGTGLVAGLDGSVWLSGRSDGMSYRLGAPAALTAHIDAVGPDGTVWDTDYRGEDDEGKPGWRLRSFDGEGWTAHDLNGPEQVEVLADGSVWVAGSLNVGGEAWSERLGPDGWETVPAPGAFERLITSASGEFIYAVAKDAVWAPSTDGGWTRLTRFEDIWPEAEYAEVEGRAAVADDGTVWTTVYAQGPIRRLLAHFDGSGWTTSEPPEGFGVNVEELGRVAPKGVTPEGTVWMAGSVDSCWGTEGGVGVIGSDGTTWSQYLDGHCAAALDISPDGTVWVMADGLYVITPGATTATE